MVKVRDELKLNNPGSELTGIQYIEAFDTGGNLVFTAKATLVGTRVRAEAPPAP
jgi:hypothetical protein